MPFCYGVISIPATPLTCHGTPNTENPNLVMRQATRGFDVLSMTCAGRAAAATTITGIEFRTRRWTTAGSGGTAITPQPRRIGTTASTTAADSATSITPGTVSGAYVAVMSCGASGPGGWNAVNADAAIHVEGGSSDELSVNSVCGVASLLLAVGAEIAE